MTGPCQKTKLKTGDYIIVAVVLLCAALLSFGFAGKSTPRELTLSIGGETAARYVLPLRAEYPLDTLPYPCTLRIDGYSVSVRDTTCPGHDCEHSGTISQSGESIVCLPNRLILTLVGGTPGVDAVTQ